MTPMIDVIFLLLIYFFLSTVHAPPESRLSPALQAERVRGGAGADFQAQIVDVRPVEGRAAFVVGSRAVFDAPSLRRVLEALPKEGGVFVRGHEGVRTTAAVDALQAARDAGFERVTYVPATD